MGSINVMLKNFLDIKKNKAARKKWKTEKTPE